MSIAYYNGQFMPIEKVSIPLTDRAVFFGDGIYDAAMGTQDGIHLFEEHVSRFIGNAGRLALDLPYTRGELSYLLKKSAELSEEPVFFLYFQLTRYGGRRIHFAERDARSNLLITVTPVPAPDPDRVLRLVTYPDRRYEYCDIKTLNLLPSVLASTYAEEHGADEAVLVRDGYVTEGSRSNVHIVKDGTLITHPLCEKILPGVTRALLLEGCRKIGVPYIERPFTEEELFSADEILVTGASKLCLRGVMSNSDEKMPKSGEIGKKLTDFVHFSFVESTKRVEV